MSSRVQRILIWWSVAFMVAYGLSLWLLLHMVPPPSALLTPDQVSRFYAEHHTSIRAGAVICTYTGAFLIPITVVLAHQVRRVEKGRVWSVLTLIGGVTMSIFLVLPPLFYGTAAYSATLAPQVTDLMHELAMLTLVTTDQYYIFMWIAIAIICFKTTTVPHSPFHRWFGYLTVWSALMFEAGAAAFLFRSGPFAWNGIMVFWFPLSLFGVWLAVACVVLFRAIRRQQEAGEDSKLPEPEASVGVAVA